MKISQMFKFSACVAMASLAIGIAAQTLGPPRGAGSNNITSRPVVAIDQSKIALKSEAPNLSNLCSVGDARCVTPVLTCAAGKVASGGSCVTAVGLGGDFAPCPGTQVRSGASCVEASTLSAAASGSTCGLHISYGGSAAPGSFWNGNSRTIATCKGYSVASAVLDWYLNPEVCTNDAGSCTSAYYSQRYFTIAYCPPGYGYNILSSSDEAQSWTCYAY